LYCYVGLYIWTIEMIYIIWLCTRTNDKCNECEKYIHHIIRRSYRISVNGVYPFVLIYIYVYNIQLTQRRFFLEPVKGWSVWAGSIIGLPEATTSQPKSAYSKYNGVFRFQIVGRLSCEFKSNCGFLFASVIVLGVVFVFVDGIVYYNIRRYGVCYTKLCIKLNHPTTLRIATN